MADKKGRGVSNLPVKIQDVPDAPTVSASDVGTSRAYNNGAATVTITPTTGGQPSSYSITTTPSTSTTTATSSPVTLTGLSSATSYTVSVTPSNASGISGAAKTSSSFTATTVPQAPTIGTASVTNSTTVSLPFTAGNTGGSAITSYTVTSSPSISLSYSGTTSPFTITGSFAAGQAYTFTIVANNANGASAASSASNSITPFNPYWIARLGDAAAESGTDITTDSSGNIYVCGTTASASGDILLAKFDGFGSLQWQTSLGSSAPNSSKGIEIDSSGNVYVCGTTSYGVGNAYTYMQLAKYNSSGTLQWQYQLGRGGGYNSVASGIALDSSSNIYITGNSDAAGSGQDMIVAKYDSSGTLQWSRKFDSTSNDYGNGISVDSSGNIYAVGQTPIGSWNTSLLKYNSSGTLQWQRLLDGTSGSGADQGYGVGTDSSGNVYVCGTNYDATLGTCGYIAKYNSSGTLQWQKALTSGEFSSRVAVDSSNNLYVAGGSYIAKYDSSGTLQWQRSFNGGISNIRCGNNNTICVVGTSGNDLFLASLPNDGSKTGTYSLESTNYTLSASNYTTGSSTMNSSTTTYSEAAASNLSDPGVTLSNSSTSFTATLTAL